MNILIVDGDVSEAEELENEPNREFDIVGTVFDGMKAVDEIIRKKPEVVLIDIAAISMESGLSKNVQRMYEYEAITSIYCLTSIGTKRN